jgi:hypothetical protein
LEQPLACIANVAQTFRTQIFRGFAYFCVKRVRDGSMEATTTVLPESSSSEGAIEEKFFAVERRSYVAYAW